MNDINIQIYYDIVTVGYYLFAPFIMPTGFIVHDAILLGSFHHSESIVPIGDSGIGKKTLILDIALDVATELNNGVVAVFSPGTPGS